MVGRGIERLLWLGVLWVEGHLLLLGCLRDEPHRMTHLREGMRVMHLLLLDVGILLWWRQHHLRRSSHHWAVGRRRHELLLMVDLIERRGVHHRGLVVVIGKLGVGGIDEWIA